MKKNKDLSGPEKAAVLLLSLGNDFASNVMQNLRDQEIKTLSDHMSRVENIPGELSEEVIKEFCKMSSLQSGLSQINKNDVREMLTRAVGEKRAESIAVGLDSKTQIFQNIDPEALINLLKTEHPQTIALILAHLSPDQSAEVLRKINDDLRSDVSFRMASLDKVSSDAIDDLAEVLNQIITPSKDVEKRNLGGVASLAEVLNVLDKETENSILENIEESDPDLAVEIRKLMFAFDDLAFIDDRGMQAILKEVNKEDLSLSMKKSSDEVKEKFLKNMSERASTMLREDLEAMGPVRLSDVEKAQQSIIGVAKRLESEGKIVIGGRGGGEDVLV